MYKKIWVYGAPFSGKTTLAVGAPDHYVLSTDGNAQYVTGKDNYKIINDRRTAIKTGVDMLEKDDILLVLGKGHENYQIIGDVKHHFDDREELRGVEN